ncbi:hypothetical protein HYALB_00008669 [Hymenoscyphus albidus]|uniref:2EXR domain-containing protein n=1 Tax=Hymenoscyphus albidus TaxID=595503 RepID=A0A9N9PS35_9HELO|nr:hypothetical protein HYALB_00008669 [Hymenoscyphus albidus]
MSPSSSTEKTSSGLNIESDLAGLDLSTSPTMGNQQSDQEAIRETTLMPLYNMAESTSPKVAEYPSNNAGANENSLAPTTLNSFTRFMDLPTELRLAIWELSCEMPRFVDFWMGTTRNIKCPNIDAKHRRRTEKYLNSFACRPVYKSHAKTVPSILHTSQEARAVGLNYFSPLFNEYQHNIPVRSFAQPQVYRVPPQFYFNRAYDILVIPPSMSAAMGYETMNHLVKKICSGDIRKIAVSSFEGSYLFLPRKALLQTYTKVWKKSFSTGCLWITSLCLSILTTEIWLILSLDLLMTRLLAHYGLTRGRYWNLGLKVFALDMGRRWTSFFKADLMSRHPVNYQV